MSRLPTKDLLNRLSDWLRADRATPDLSQRVERLWRETELPSLRQIAERFHLEAEWTSFAGMLDGIQAHAAWPRLTHLLDRAQLDIELPSLASLTEKLERDFHLPEIAPTLSPQHRQVLRGVLLLGMALHTSPVPLLKVSPPCTGSRASITETRGGEWAQLCRDAAGAQYVLVDAAVSAVDITNSDLPVAALPAAPAAGEIPAAAEPIAQPATNDAPRQLARRPGGARAPPA